jgi:uncharacterized protein (DUF1501 family)
MTDQLNRRDFLVVGAAAGLAAAAPRTLFGDAQPLRPSRLPRR